MTAAGFSEAGPSSGKSRLKVVPSRISSMFERASGCRRRLLGEKTISYGGDSGVENDGGDDDENDGGGSDDDDGMEGDGFGKMVIV